MFSRPTRPTRTRWIGASCSIYSVQSSRAHAKKRGLYIARPVASVYCASGSPAASSITERPVLITFAFQSMQTRGWMRDSPMGVCETGGSVSASASSDLLSAFLLLFARESFELSFNLSSLSLFLIIFKF